MKTLWVVAVLSAAVCVAASMVLFGQYALRTKLSADEADQRLRYHTMDTAFSEENFIRNALASQLDLQRKTIQELEGERDKATAEKRQKAADLDACTTDKKKKDEELAVAQKAQADTEGFPNCVGI
ncbi:hypothetical protein CRUP_002149 [Coryphaenoides rupestris]|nr:hypothetical protein CRUP_002149 [Coryphaenoides rupestris]